MFKQALGNSRVPLRSLALMFALLVSQNSWACYSPPGQQSIGADELIMRVSEVSVAKVISTRPLKGNVVEYRFVVLERLAGPDSFTFTVMGRAGGSDNASFDNHTAPAFWSRGGGRVKNDTDCQMHPDFVIGDTYLVFLDTPWSWRSFGKIERADGAFNRGDKWLAYVKAGLEERKASEASYAAGCRRNRSVA